MRRRSLRLKCRWRQNYYIDSRRDARRNDAQLFAILQYTRKTPLSGRSTAVAAGDTDTHTDTPICAQRRDTSARFQEPRAYVLQPAYSPDADDRCIRNVRATVATAETTRALGLSSAHTICRYCVASASDARDICGRSDDVVVAVVVCRVIQVNDGGRTCTRGGCGGGGGGVKNASLQSVIGVRACVRACPVVATRRCTFANRAALHTNENRSDGHITGITSVADARTQTRMGGLFSFACVCVCDSISA